MTDTAANCKPKINRVETTSDCLTDRAGLALFARYLSSIVALPPLIDRYFGSLRKSHKGLPIMEWTRSFAAARNTAIMATRWCEWCGITWG